MRWREEKKEKEEKKENWTSFDAMHLIKNKEKKKQGTNKVVAVKKKKEIQQIDKW